MKPRLEMATFRVASYGAIDRIITTTEGDRCVFWPTKHHVVEGHADPKADDVIQITKARYFSPDSALVHVGIVNGCVCTDLSIRPLNGERIE